jgi:hypothetical protein
MMISHTCKIGLFINCNKNSNQPQQFIWQGILALNYIHLLLVRNDFSQMVQRMLASACKPSRSSYFFIYLYVNPLTLGGVRCVGIVRFL